MYRDQRTKTTLSSGCCLISVLQLQSWTKVLGHLGFWDVFPFTQNQPLPSPHKQCWTRVSRIFSEFQLCIGWGEGERQENFEKDALK